MNLNTLILLNTSSPQHRQAIEYIFPYLDHFGVPYRVWDINQAPLPADLKDYPLVVIAHPLVDPRGHQLNRKRLQAAVQAGTGLVTFDPMLEQTLGRNQHPPVAVTAGEAGKSQPTSDSRPEVVFVKAHAITSRHAVGDSIHLAAPLRLSPISGDILVTAGRQPLLSISTQGAGRIVRWASADWMDTHYLGPLGGLDDVLWRSLAWAARKPFVMRGLPPLVTMRVDDVAGTGHLWGQSPLGWVHAANRFGFKPWLGIFPFNLTETAITELRELLLSGKATAFPHAFGRPMRGSNPSPEGSIQVDAGSGPGGYGEPCPYYNSSGFPLRATTYDEFIFYDHENQRPWSNREAARGLAAIDNWYTAHASLPKSSYAVAHWGEMGSNTVSHVRDRWSCEYIGSYHGINAPLDGAAWLASGPFRKHETPGSALFDRSDRGDRPVYYADFINFANRQFFLCCTEVRDETGYEWAPDGEAEKSAGRGLRQLKRALDSFALPVLFTHETDYVYKISPQAWEAQLGLIVSGLSGYDPIYVSLDEGIRYVRATKTSQLASAAYDPVSRQVTVNFTGRSDVLTHFYLFIDEHDITSKLVEVPPFEERNVIRFTC